MKSIPLHCPCNLAAVDSIGPGGANHHYIIRAPGGSHTAIKFQKGAIGGEGSEDGILDDCLLAICYDRLEAFQNGPYACPENARALEAIEKARDALSLRVARRLAQGILGQEREN